MKLPRLHPQTWYKDIMCESLITEEDKPKIITIMYSIWLSRNKWTHGESEFHSTSSMEYVRDTLLTLELPPVLQKTPKSRLECKW
jgi:hypothetical protein